MSPLESQMVPQDSMSCVNNWHFVPNSQSPQFNYTPISGLNGSLFHPSGELLIDYPIGIWTGDSPFEAFTYSLGKGIHDAATSEKASIKERKLLKNNGIKHKDIRRALGTKGPSSFLYLNKGPQDASDSTKGNIKLVSNCHSHSLHLTFTEKLPLKHGGCI